MKRGALRQTSPSCRSWCASGEILRRLSKTGQNLCLQGLALLWQIIANGKVIGFPNQFFNDSWVVGLWRADHCENDEGLGSRA
jgi:hypothetical protein